MQGLGRLQLKTPVIRPVQMHWVYQLKVPQNWMPPMRRSLGPAHLHLLRACWPLRPLWPALPPPGLKAKPLGRSPPPPLLLIMPLRQRPLLLTLSLLPRMMLLPLLRLVTLQPREGPVLLLLLVVSLALVVRMLALEQGVHRWQARSHLQMMRCHLRGSRALQQWMGSAGFSVSGHRRSSHSTRVPALL